MKKIIEAFLIAILSIIVAFLAARVFTFILISLVTFSDISLLIPIVAFIILFIKIYKRI